MEATRSIDLTPSTHERGTPTQSDGDDELGFDLDPFLAAVPDRIGEYSIEKLIGAGGMGRVYKAEHRRMARIVALKTMAPDRMQDESSVLRFYAEVRAAARLLHPNIVTAFDAGEYESTHYLAMEYVEGESLSQLVTRQGPLPVAEAVRILRGAATGLACAHAAGIVHRDVKPGNIMVAQDGTVKVLDLGLATIRSDPAHRPSRKGRLVGTFQYIAPEQLDDPDAADPRADIYSLGATFYYLLAGRSPYEGEMMDQLRLHRDGPLPDLFHVRKDVDLRLDHIFQRMMAKRPQDRYSSIVELLEELHSWQLTAGSNHWLSHWMPNLSPGEVPTNDSDPSTATNPYTVFGIDLGMTYISAAIADPSGAVELVDAGGPGQALLRAAISSNEGKLSLGEAALANRIDHPQSLAHCVQLYIGQSRVDRKILDQQCPPEVLLAMLLQHTRATAWGRKGRPTVAAITLPACYDQLHRRSIHQAAQLAGFESIRLVDRGLAAAHSQLEPTLAASPIPLPHETQHWLVVSLTGLACEAMVVRHLSGRIQTLASAGSWLTGQLVWQRRMVDLIAERCKKMHGIDPRDRLRDAIRLQQASERGMSDLLLRTSTQLQFRSGGRQLTIPVERSLANEAGEGVIQSLLEYVSEAVMQSGITTDQFQRVLLIGSLSRMQAVRQGIQDLIGNHCELIPMERRALAQGAALAAAAELPGRAGEVGPPLSAATYDLGLVAYTTGDSQPRTLPVIPRGSTLPARTGRRLSRIKESGQKSITVVESAGGVGRPWRSLGSHPLLPSEINRNQEAIFEVDFDGLLTIRIRGAETGETVRLPPLPTPSLGLEKQREWAIWVRDATLAK